MLNFFNNYKKSDIDLLKIYLKERYEFKKEKNINRLNIVFDIFKDCDLACVGCGTDAKFVASMDNLELIPTKEKIFCALDKIYSYSKEKKCSVFINYGGGEPFLRKDILEILEYSAKLFGANSIGIDTNGTLDNSFELIWEASKYVSYIGISINGLEKYHNWWSGNNRINAFNRSIETAKKLCLNKDIIEKLEISSVATKNNYKDLPKLMEIVASIGVKNYSIHRAMPVGRMKKNMNLIMNYKEYFELLIDLVKKSKTLNISAHLHHSIESIYSTLLLGIDTHLEDKVGNPDLGSSLGIEPDGDLVFDPWCTTGIWKKISAGNLFEDKTDLFTLLNSPGDSLFDLTNLYTARNLRCKGCSKPCSGGSRVVAAAENLNKEKEENLTINNILDAFTEKDPACPLNYEIE